MSTHSKNENSDNTENAENLESTHFSFVQTEHATLKFWKEKQIFKKSLEQTKNKPPYIFYDGPPFATGLPHHGHLVGSTLKDIVPRYFTMRGNYVERRFGWDCHGLPIEYEIDKSLNMPASEAVKKLGIKGYNDQCRGIVQTYVKEWQKTIERIGRWVDFENDYKTMDTPFMESVWWVFKQLWTKGLVYQSTKVMPFSTALGTPLSNFEAGSNYQQVQDPAITVAFTLKEPFQGRNVAMAAWTTTPWTLPSNLGLCVHPDLEYDLIKFETFATPLFMAKARGLAFIEKYKGEILATVKGSELAKKEYLPLFPYYANLSSEGAFRVFADEYVTTEDGTGVVHLAPAFGEDDHRIFKANQLGHLNADPINLDGKFTTETSDLAGLYVKDADKEIIKTLKTSQKIFEHSSIVHSYPFCPRSKTPLIYKAIPSWFVSVEKIKDQMLSSNEQIHWVPEHLKNGRFGKWLENARDWAISRNRIWGTPIPLWINDETKKIHCMGSIKELTQLTHVEVTDLHRENVDGLTFKIAGEKGVYHRIPEVLDCWFESGSMPYAQLHYPFENQKLFEEGFPAQYIAEGLDQTRGWFYTLTVLSSALFNKPAFKNVIVNGLVLAKDGKKMSKSLRNYTAPDTLMEEYGADALRLFLINSGLVKAEDLRFHDDGVKDMVRRALLPWYNSFSFFQTYAKIDQWVLPKPGSDLHKKIHAKNAPILDRWILSKLQTLINTVNTEMEQYHLYNVVPALLEFIDDLTNWYIRLNRRRFWSEETDTHAFLTLGHTLNTLNTLMAPFTPFLSEHLHQEFRKSAPWMGESIHLETFPRSSVQDIDVGLEKAVKAMQEVIILGRQKRTEVKIKVKTPLRKLTIIHEDDELLFDLKTLEATIKTELNVKEIAYDQNESRYVSWQVKPNSPILGKRLGKKFADIQKALLNLSKEQLKQLAVEQEITILEEKLGPGDFFVSKIPLSGVEVVSNQHVTILLDCVLDEELESEGDVRELLNRIQKARKDAHFLVSDRIKIQLQVPSKLQNSVTKMSDYFKEETLCEELSFASSLNKQSPSVFYFEDELNEEKISFCLEKVSISK
ncbi:MAG: isoleucine--tRNA ligase [Bacteriovoracaceae bacterium]|nr:isoleucine--tRNA ligase [Bacteriovoracaceae bacterium]